MNCALSEVKIDQHSYNMIYKLTLLICSIVCNLWQKNPSGAKINECRKLWMLSFGIDPIGQLYKYLAATDKNPILYWSLSEFKCLVIE